MNIYLIRSLTQTDDDNGDALWWNTEEGFTTIIGANVFTQTDRDSLNLPFDSEWVEFYHH